MCAIFTYHDNNSYKQNTDKRECHGDKYLIRVELSIIKRLKLSRCPIRKEVNLHVHMFKENHISMAS